MNGNSPPPQLRMNDLKYVFRQLLKNPGFTAVTVLTSVLGLMGSTPALAHPGSGIVVDRQGRVFFTDTGQGIWMTDERGKVSSHEGPAYHWMAIDLDNRFAGRPWPSFIEPSGDIRRAGVNPTLLLASDFPLTTDRDGALFYPELGEDKKLRVYRIVSSGERTVLATLPAAADGKPLQWLNGMAAGPDRSIYFSENSAVRRITRQGVVGTIASNIVVAGCVRIPGASERLGPFLRGLDVTSDGTIYVAANGCCALLRITPQGQVTTVLHTDSPWSPTGVAVSGDAIYVLEYLHTDSGDRREWTPRVRKISPDGSVALVAKIERTGPDTSRAVQLPATVSPNSFFGTKAGQEIEVGGVLLCWCPPGKFRMGSPTDEPGRRADESPVEVTLTKGFWAGKHEVTQGQWKRVMGEVPGPLNAGAGDDLPVYWVSFIEAEAFCQRLTEQTRASGKLAAGWKFELPTEAQWEYACRAGTTTAFSFGDTLTDRQANIGKPYNGTPTGVPGSAATPVGSYPANAWGLHDMHGNEFEWCRDWYHAQRPGGIDPDLSELKGQPNRDGTFSRVRRGGAWMDPATFCRSAMRLRYEPERRADHIGFRVVIMRP